MTPIHVRMMAAYGAWMNGRMLELCGTLTDAERRRDLGAFFKSIHGTFDHLVYGDVAWMGRFTGSPMPTKRIGIVVHESWDELAAARRAMDVRMEDWAGDVTEQWLAETMSYRQRERRQDPHPAALGAGDAHVQPRHPSSRPADHPDEAARPRARGHGFALAAGAL